MKHLPWKLFFTTLGLAVLFDILFFRNTLLGLNVFLFHLIGLLAAFFFAHRVNKKIPKEAWVAGGFALAFSFTFVIWTSEISLVLSGLSMLLADVLVLLFLMGYHGKLSHPVQLVATSADHLIGKTLKRFKVYKELKVPKATKEQSAVVRGLIIGLPIVAVFFLLFVQSDLVLEQSTHNFLETLDEFFARQNIFAHIAIVGFWSVLLFLLFATMFWDRVKQAAAKTKHKLARTESTIILILVNVLFIAVMIFQAAYLFGGRAAWTAIEGITYSEYAVHGFNELGVITALVLALVITLRHFHGEKTKTLLKWLEVGLLAETFLILISAWMRMQLYVAEYGFSPARLFGFWFFILAGVILVLFIAHILKGVMQYKFLQQSAIVTGIAILLFTMMAPDALAVRLNIARADRLGEPVDAFPLYHQLSAEAYPLMSFTLQHLEHNGYDESTKYNHETNWYERQRNQWCRRVDDNGNRYHGGEKGEWYYEDERSWKNWNLSRDRIPTCHK